MRVATEEPIPDTWSVDPLPALSHGVQLAARSAVNESVGVNSTTAVAAAATSSSLSTSSQVLLIQVNWKQPGCHVCHVSAYNHDHVWALNVSDKKINLISFEYELIALIDVWCESVSVLPLIVTLDDVDSVRPSIVNRPRRTCGLSIELINWQITTRCCALCMRLASIAESVVSHLAFTVELVKADTVHRLESMHCCTLA